MKKGRLGFIVSALAIMVASPLIEPRLLAFPYDRTIGADHVYATVPIDPAQMSPILTRANGLVETSPLHQGREGRNIFLTDGGWRWYWLAARSQGGFALSRPLRNPIIVNRSDMTRDRVYNGAPVGGSRSLSGVIAHEKCHGMLQRHFGLQRAFLVAPTWVTEGYCDYVARESSLTDSQARALDAAHSGHPALIYYHGRQKVAAVLAANGGSVDALFDAAK